MSPGDSMVGKGPLSILSLTGERGHSLHPAGQSLLLPMPRETSVAWSSTLCVEFSCLNSSLKPASVIPERCILHPAGSLDKCLGTPDGEWGISPGVLV